MLSVSLETPINDHDRKRRLVALASRCFSFDYNCFSATRRVSSRPPRSDQQMGGIGTGDAPGGPSPIQEPAPRVGSVLHAARRKLPGARLPASTSKIRHDPGAVAGRSVASSSEDDRADPVEANDGVEELPPRPWRGGISRGGASPLEAAWWGKLAREAIEHSLGCQRETHLRFGVPIATQFLAPAGLRESLESEHPAEVSRGSEERVS